MTKQLNFTGVGGYTQAATPRIIPFFSTDIYATLISAGYLNTVQDSNQLLSTDIICASYSGGSGFFTVSIASDKIITLAPQASMGEVTLPVVSGNFSVFSGTAGVIADLGYLPSNAAKTTVVMASAAVLANHIACFSDTAGTVNDDPAIAINGGDLQAGLNAVAGKLRSYSSTTTTGYAEWFATANSGAFNIGYTNAAFGQSTVITTPDPVSATANNVIAPAALVSGNIPQASGTAGLIIDSGVAANALRKFAQVSLTAVQFNGMYAAPVLLVAAPGANSMIVVESIELVMTYVSAAYANGGVVAAQYDSTANGAGVIASTTEAAADFFATASTVFKMKGGLVLSPFTTCANKGLYLSNVTGAFTTGDSTWIVKVYYHVISTTA